MASNWIEQLKRDARRLSRGGVVPHHEALDRVARRRGFATWSLLLAKTSSRSASEMLDVLQLGELVLLAARPGQGKTLVSLALAAEAVRRGRPAAFFTLEDTEATVFDVLRRIGAGHVRASRIFRVDTSDAISAEYVIASSESVGRGSVIVIDCLQALDQCRDTPTLSDQLCRLKDFARRREAIMLFLAQVDRSYDSTVKRFPDFGDVRRSNSIDPNVFGKSFFLSNGDMHSASA